MTGPRGNVFRLIPSTFEAYAEPDFDIDLGTFDTDDLWGFPPFAWRLPAAALAVGVAAGWLLRGAR